MDQETQEIAKQRFQLAQIVGQKRAALWALDDLRMRAPQMHRADVFDGGFEVFAVWKSWLFDFEMTTGMRVTDEDFVTVWLHTADFVSEAVAVDFLAERFAEDRVIRTPEGSINWHSANGEVTVSRPGVTSVLVGDRMERVL